MVAALALSVTAARVLGPVELGRQSIIAFVEAALCALVVNSLSDATIRTLAETLGRGNALVATRIRRWSFAAHALTGAASGLVLVAIGLTQRHQRAAWMVVAISAVVNALVWAFSSQIIAERGWRPVATRRLVSQFVGPLLGIAAVLAGFGVVGIFVANVIAASGLAIFLHRLAPIPRPAPTRVPLPRDLIRLWGLFTLIELLTQVVLKRVEFLFLSWFSSASEVAMYSIPFMIVSAAGVVPVAMATAAMPAIARAIGRGERKKAEAGLGWAIRIVMIGSLPLVCMLAGLGPLLVQIIYGADYAKAGSLVPLAALALLVAPAAQVSASYWVGVGLVRPMLIGGFVGAVVDLVAALALIPAHGATGAVLANLAGQGVMAAVLIGYTVHHLSTNPLLGGRWLHALLAAAVAVTVARVLAVAFGGLLGLMLGGVGCLLAFFAMGAWLRLLRIEDAEPLMRILPARLAGPVRLLVRR